MLRQNLGKSTRASYANVVMSNTNQNDVHNQNDLQNPAESSDVRSQNVNNDDEISIDSNLHPFYHQNIDYPRLILISKKLTVTDNFGP